MNQFFKTLAQIFLMKTEHISDFCPFDASIISILLSLNENIFIGKSFRNILKYKCFIFIISLFESLLIVQLKFPTDFPRSRYFSQKSHELDNSLLQNLHITILFYYPFF